MLTLPDVMKHGRNKLCWCGSGRKYKHCHLNRERQEQSPPSKSIEEFQEAHGRRLCYHPEASPKTCAGPIVRAHTVQERLLRIIAEKGHVYGIPMHVGSLYSSGGVIRPRLIGLDKASTFTGFCNKHDTSLFSDIETCPIEASARHTCLLAYRALCRELYAKEGGMFLEDHFRQLDRGFTLPDQVKHQEQVSMLIDGMSAGLRDIRSQKARYDQILVSSDYGAVKYCVIWFERPPDIMCSSGKNPILDFEGKRLQDLSDLTTPAQGLTISLLASANRGGAFFSWLSSEERSCVEFLSSLLRQGFDQIPHALVRLVSGFENQFWRPSWWDSLTQPQKNWLLGRLNSAANLFEETPLDYLMDDGMRLVNWHVTEIESNDNRLAN